MILVNLGYIIMNKILKNRLNWYSTVLFIYKNPNNTSNTNRQHRVKTYLALISTKNKSNTINNNIKNHDNISALFSFIYPVVIVKY